MHPDRWAELKRLADLRHWDIDEASRAVEECLMEIQESQRSLTERVIANIHAIAKAAGDG